MKRKYSQFELWIRSLVFSITFVTIIIPYGVCVCFASVLPLAIRWQIIRHYLKVNLFLLEKICHIRYRVEGLENLPKDHAGIVLSKHQSTWETIFLPMLLHDPAIIVKRELLRIPLFGWGLYLSAPIAINRNDRSSAMQQIIVKGKKCLDAGRWILIFPEGTRVAPGTVGHYRMGGPRLAASTGYPVLPVAHNAGRFWGRRKFIKQPGTITVVLGPLIESKDRTPEEILTLSKNWIETTMTRIDSLVNKSAG